MAYDIVAVSAAMKISVFQQQWKFTHKLSSSVQIVYNTACYILYNIETNCDELIFYNPKSYF